MDGADLLKAAELTGRCQCGAVRYRVRGPAVRAYLCHCLECRRQSASAFGLSVIVRAADFELIQGETQVWTRPTDSGGAMDCHFCPTCGGRLFHQAKAEPEALSVKGGTIDGLTSLTGFGQIWTERALKGA